MTADPRRVVVRQEGRPDAGGTHVIYWMQQSQRVHRNHALATAVGIANDAGLPVTVVFVVDPSYPGANLRSFAFMFEGLRETAAELDRRGIGFVLRRGDPATVVGGMLGDACALVCDTGYLSHQRTWRTRLADAVRAHHPSLRFLEVDSDVVVPVRLAYPKAAYAAYAIRPALMRQYGSFLSDGVIPEVRIRAAAAGPRDWTIPAGVDASVPESPVFQGGRTEALRRFERFLETAADRYPDASDPGGELTSGMSPYLHFGQIAAVELLDRITAAHAAGTLRDAAFDDYLEQLLVRRELAVNFVWHTAGYDKFETMTEPWAYRTMTEHADDPRPVLYSFADLEAGNTADPYYNAAMAEMRKSGFMHTTMRMYWAKKIIEWTPSFRTAYETIVALDDRWFLDGRDANGYAGAAWCFGKHDRPWGERPVFGTLRYMNDRGLERKYDMRSYVARVASIPDKRP
ncbi:MAG: deoxyribodipyrimidine photo-lyase [Candidatus Izemoplasmatales bacterium]